MSRTRLCLVGATLLSAFFIAACGEDTVSADELSSQTQTALEESVGAPLESVDCPETTAEVGETFACDGTTPDGSEIKIEGEITEVDSESGSVNFNVEVVSP
jgi:hypothetical protein